MKHWTYIGGDTCVREFKRGCLVRVVTATTITGDAATGASIAIEYVPGTTLADFCERKAERKEAAR